MPQYLVSTYMPDDFDPSTVTEETIEAIYALNRELIAAGKRKFACGVAAASDAKTLRMQQGDDVSVTDGPYIETKEHIGGLLVLEAANLEEALDWARRGVLAGGMPVEVRELLFFPDPKASTD
ncbi:MAG: hypothetical protein KDC95_16150 [Planctomycetes bacterium]|nr:hypothetical protein [Planctomycetota bacterium]